MRQICSKIYRRTNLSHYYFYPLKIQRFGNRKKTWQEKQISSRNRLNFGIDKKKAFPIFTQTLNFPIADGSPRKSDDSVFEQKRYSKDDKMIISFSQCSQWPSQPKREQKEIISAVKLIRFVMGAKTEVLHWNFSNISRVLDRSILTLSFWTKPYRIILRTQVIYNIREALNSLSDTKKVPGYHRVFKHSVFLHYNFIVDNHDRRIVCL